MDIDRLSLIGSTLDQRLKKKKDDDKSRVGRTSSKRFGDVVQKSSDEAAAAAALGHLPSLDGTETVEGLLDEVHATGEALKKDPVFGPMNGYKKAVRRFLSYVLEHGIEKDETLGIRNPRTMQQKKYVMIRVVDQRLENLAAYVLKGQAEQLDILRRIDEIHGMLVDLKG